MEGLKEALKYVSDLARENEKTEVLEICGKTYANRDLTRYDQEKKARAIEASTLSAMVDYIENLNEEFPKGRKMILHIVAPETVQLVSSLDGEREREILFFSKAVVSGFRFGQWYDQEDFMIAAQSNFMSNLDMIAVMQMAGNIDKKNNQSYSDDGVSQVATITVGVAAKADALVPNPVELIPYRTFQEVAQPASKFVFRIGDKEVPAFKLVEAAGGIWKNEAIANIKQYFRDHIPDALKDRIVIIG